MKKTKLLTSVAALALVLSLGACNQPEEDTSEDEETSQTTETDTGSSVEPVTLKNYTISITLKDAATEESVAIPFYDSVYICGSWDNWAEWTVLTDIGDETESVLTTTFASIEEGTYNFKGVVGGQDETPSWSLTELIVSSTGGDVSFEVNAEDGDNYTNNLEFTVDATKVPVLEETPMTEEEIAGLIIEAAGDVYDNLGWDAFHGKEVEDEELSMEVWLTTDEDGEVYGKVVSYDDEDVETRFIVSGVQYTIEVDGEYTTYVYNQDYEDEFSNYADGLDTVSSAEAYSCEITHVEGSTTYTLTLGDDEDETVVVVAQRAGDVFTVISVLESEDDEEYFAENITTSEVETQMKGFNANYWREPFEDVESLLTAISEGQNFTLGIEYYEYYSDVYSSSTEASSAWNSGNYYNQDLYVEITFTEDAVLMEYYYVYYYYLVLVDVELYVNTTYYNQSYPNGTPATAVYWLGDDGETLELQGYYQGYWQDNSIGCYALDLVNYTNYFTAGETTEGQYGTTTEYDVTKTDYSFMMTLMYGLFWANNSFGSYYSYGINSLYNILDNYVYSGNADYFDYFDVSATYYYDYEELDIEIDTKAITWTSSSGSWVDQDFMLASVYDVGISEIPEEYASYLA